VIRFFPARVIANQFRDFFLEGLEELFESKQLILTKDNDYLIDCYSFKKCFKKYRTKK
jgi:hypothetical protein